jgi:ATP-dependent Clp protease ATP-binding subunit ClpA
MFERFTDRARRAVVLSQEEARRLRHNYIGTEHVMLGLLGESQGVAARVLNSFGMWLDGVRAEVVEMVGEGQDEAAPQRIPFTPRAKKTLELALRESLQLNHNYIGTEHILLGLIREGDGIAAKIMGKHADLVAIRAMVIEQVPAWHGDVRDPTAVGVRRRGGAPGPRAFGVEPEPASSPAADVALAEAARLAGAQPVGSHHLLLAALADPTSAAAKALASAGVDLDQAKDALRGVDITGTSDEQPQEAGRRQMNIQVSDELVTVVAADPAIVEAGQAAVAALGAGDAGGAGGQMAVPGGVIRGADLSGAAATSLAAAWQALRDSLVEVARASAAAQAPQTPQISQTAQASQASQTAQADDEPGAETA